MSRFLRPLAIVAALSVALAACSKCGGQDEKTTAPASAEAPVAAPDGLIADVYVGTPNASWGKLQRGIGGAVGILPPAASGMVCTTFGIDFGFAQEIDGVAPAYAVIAGDPVDPSWAFALKLVDMRRARGALLGDDTSRFAGKELADGLTEILPKSGALPGTTQALALTKNGWMVVAKRSADLGRLAPYLTRTLPTRTLPEGAVVVDVPHAAIQKILAPKLDAAWGDAKQFLLAQDERMRHDHGGRAPDYGDPQAIVASIDAVVGRRIAIVHDLDKVRFVLDVGDQNVTVSATLAPAAGGGAATKWLDGMRTGDAAQILAMPQGSALAFATRDNDDDRAAQGADLEKAMTQSLGARLGEADAKRVHTVVEDWTKARGETLAGSVMWDDPRAWFVRGSVKDGEAADRAVRSALELARVSPFKEMLRAKEVAIAHEEVAGLSRVNVATMTREAKDGGAPPAPAPKLVGDGGLSAPRRKDVFALAWVVENGAIDLATGEEPIAALRESARPERKLGDDPVITAAVSALGGGASTIVVAQPLRFDAKRANLPIAPMVLGIGKKEKDGFVRLDVSDGVLREVARVLMGI